jgi:uncharacterized protein (DUF1800 family)
MEDGVISRRELLVAASALLGLSPVRAQRAPDDAAHLLLRRLSYSVRPEELARLRAFGTEQYLAEQLAPEQLDDSVCEARLKPLGLLQLDRHALYRLQNAQARAERTSIEAFLIRAVYSRRQLLERMVDFWTDHFNVPLNFDSSIDVLLFQRTLRQHALGKFSALLLAVSQSPAMLWYLDNATSSKEAPNQNYARELLELHTLGVDGGYSEADVHEVARAFTGWTVHNRSATGFYFNEAAHDTDEKLVLGHRLPAGRGIEDGLHVLRILVEHPATARFVCSKLCVKFVSDTPPQPLVDELVVAWQASQRDMRAVLRALFLSPHFYHSSAPKFRRPLEFLVASLRATGTELLEYWELRDLLIALGQPPYGWNPPDGYPLTASAWMNTSGLLARWNAAMRLTHGAHSDAEGSRSARSQLHRRVAAVATVGELVAAVANDVFARQLSASEAAPFIAYAADGAGADEPVTPFLLGRKLASLYGLMLASPAFQWI